MEWGFSLQSERCVYGAPFVDRYAIRNAATCVTWCGADHAGSPAMNAWTVDIELIAGWLVSLDEGSREQVVAAIEFSNIAGLSWVDRS